MSEKQVKNAGCWMLLVLMSIVLTACGGGGGSSSSTSPSVAKTTISGAVTFPGLTNLVAKRVGLFGPDNSVTVQVYKLDGTKVAEVTPSADSGLALAQRVYSYSVPNLPPSVDYVIKVKRGQQIMKKLLEKKDMVVGTVPGLTVDAVSTAAVLVASQKLSTATSKVSLGDTLPAGKTEAELSASISIDVKPSLLEGSIAAAVNGGIGSLTSETASYANLFNLVVTAVEDSVDPSAVVAGTASLTSQVPVITATTAGSGASALTTMDATSAETLVSGTATSYTPPVESASTYTVLAKSYLNVQDISNASLNYEKALSIDATDKEANFGAAITSGLMLIDDPDVKSIITKWNGSLPTVNQVVQGTSPIRLPFGNMTTLRLNKITLKTTASTTTSTNTVANVLTAFNALKGSLPQQKTGFKSVAKQLALVPATAPTVSEMQALVDNVIIPRIDKILARLAKIEGKGFSFTITPAMQGNVFGPAKILDDGEFYTLDAALNIFQVILKFATAYTFDVPFGYTYDTIDLDPLAMINNPSVFTLKSDGAAKMAAALTNARNAEAKAELAYGVVNARALGVGAFDLTSWTALQKSDFTTSLSDIKASLQGAKTWVIGGKSVSIDATKFFLNPLTRANLPTFGYDVPRNANLSVKYNNAVAGEHQVTYWYFNGTTYVSGTRTEAIYCELYPTSDLPDYTLNGILPGNSAVNNIAGFNGMLPMLGGTLLSKSDNQQSRLATDGTLIYYYTFDNTGKQYLKSINPATGVITDLATSSNTVKYLAEMLWYNGSLHTLISESDVSGFRRSLYPVSINTAAKTFSVGTTPVLSSSLQSSMGYSTVTANGTDIYYTVSSWDPVTYTSTTEIRKLNQTGDVSVVTIQGYVDNLAFRGSYMYTDGNGLEKRDPTTGAVIATYTEDFDIMVGGYFYRVDMYAGKLVKFAGTPAGGAAKLATYFGL